MLRTIRRPSLLLAAPALLSLFSVGCGSSSSSNTLSAAQAQAVSEQVSETVATGMSNAFNQSGSTVRTTRPSLSNLAGKTHPADLSGCVGSDGQFNCEVPISATANCPNGGTMSVAGDATGILDSNGDGSLTTSLTITPAQCAVDGLVLNGDPNIMVNTALNFTDNGIVAPVSLSATGGITYGSHSSQSCQVNVIYSIDSSGTCTSVGTVCGQPVSGSC
jgi:hypothetical protein